MLLKMLWVWFYSPVFPAIPAPLALHGQGPEVYPSSVGRAGLHLGVWAVMFWGFLCSCEPPRPEFQPQPRCDHGRTPEQPLSGKGMGRPRKQL